MTMIPILQRLGFALAVAAAPITGTAGAPSYFDVSHGSHPHDVAAAPGRGAPVYYTAQMTGKLGILDPRSGRFDEIALGPHSAPHGVIVGPDGAAWVTDGGQNAIVRVDALTHALKVWPLPDSGNVDLNTLTFDHQGKVWFTGQNGYYGRLDPASSRSSCGRRPGAAVPMASRPRPPARCITRRWPATTSRTSTLRPAPQRSSSRRPRGRGRAACGPIRAAVCG